MANFFKPDEQIPIPVDKYSLVEILTEELLKPNLTEGKQKEINNLLINNILLPLRPDLQGSGIAFRIGCLGDVDGKAIWCFDVWNEFSVKEFEKQAA